MRRSSTGVSPAATLVSADAEGEPDLGCGTVPVDMTPPRAAGATALPRPGAGHAPSSCRRWAAASSPTSEFTAGEGGITPPGWSPVAPSGVGLTDAQRAQ